MQGEGFATNHFENNVDNISLIQFTVNAASSAG
jgi:hypothetical protein